MTELIPSEFVRNFYKENGIEFTERERAVILWNDGHMPLDQKLSELEKIAAGTADSELKQTIGAWSKYQRDSLEKSSSAESGSVFIIEYNWEITDTLFYDFEAARKYADSMKHSHDKKRKYVIKKIKVGSQSVTTDLLGGVEFNADGEITGAWDDNAWVCSRLEYLFVRFVNPFECGDIVMDCRSKKIGIVETTPKEWNELLELQKRHKGLDYSDCAVIVQYLAEDGFSHEHIQPIYLEKLPVDEKGVPEKFDIKNNIGEHLIYCASELLRGQMSLDMFTRFYTEWLLSWTSEKMCLPAWRNAVFNEEE